MRIEQIEVSKGPSYREQTILIGKLIMLRQ